MHNDTTQDPTDHTSVNWSRAKKIFSDAIELSGAERRSFVADQCRGESSTFEAVRRLLASHEEATDFLVDLTSVDTVDAHGPASKSQPMPSAVGPYEIIDRIGEGGHGVVYRARQHAPVERDVALKILKPGLESNDLIARFADERRFLARMDHPDIVKILDAGGTPDGRLFVAMELVIGETLTDYAERADLHTRDRVALVARIARAVQHAHQRAVIHRDLKPTNILVSEDDGTARLRIIDFGIAQALAPDDASASQALRAIGTPRYMSPEQAGAGGPVDIRTDVYSLGVLLCELLTGKTPRPPSTSESSRSGPIAATPPSRLVDQAPTTTLSITNIQTDLDQIVLKCVAWNPEDRYASASELADDLDRYISGYPVLAVPSSAWYSARKFTARHRTGVALGAFAAVSLLAAFSISLVLWASAVKQTAVAREAELEADRQAERAKFIAQYFIDDMLAAADPDADPGREVTAVDVLEAANRNAIDRFKNDPALLADIKGRIGIAYARLGRDTEAIAALDNAILHATTESSREQILTWSFERSLATLLVPGRHKEAGVAIRESAARIQDELGAHHPLSLRSALAASEYMQDPNARSEAVSAVEIITRDPAFAGSALRMQSLRYLGGSLLRQGDQAGATAAFEKAHSLSSSRLGADHTQSIKLQFRLSEAMVDAGRHDDGAASLRDTLQRAHATFGLGHGTLTGMQRLAVGIFLRAGRADEAVATAEDFERNALTQYGQDSIPHVSAGQEVGRALIEAGKPERALDVLQRILPLRERQWGLEHVQTAYTHRAIADAHFALESWRAAEESSAAALRSLPESSPSHYHAGATLVRARRMLDQSDEAKKLLHSLTEAATQVGASEEIRSMLEALRLESD